MQLSLIWALAFAHDAGAKPEPPAVPVAARGRLRPSAPTGPCVAEPFVTEATLEIWQRARARLQRGARHVSLDAFGCQQVLVEERRGVHREETWVFPGTVDGGPGQPRLASFVEVGAGEVMAGQIVKRKLQVASFLAKPDGGPLSSVTTVWLNGVACDRYSQKDIDGINSDFERFAWDGGWALVEQYETSWLQH